MGNSAHRRKKLLLAMKLTSLFLFLGLFAATATNSFAQVGTVTIHMEKVTLSQVFDEIEAQTSYSLFYKKDVLDDQRQVTISVTNEEVANVLKALLANDKVSYKVVDNSIVIVPDYLTANSIVVQQGKTVTGKVTDQNGEPIPGASIVVKGTTTGTISDMDGNFTLSGVPEDAILAFSFVGMRTQEIPVGDRTRFDVVMEEETIGLDEVVAIGYGTVKKSDLTGSVTQVSSEKLLSRPSFNASDALQGRVAGVKIIQRSGAPGGAPMIRIRGTNSISTNNEPLYVVDGIVGVENAMFTLNPNEIETVDVLKDASATAIYGARGANGVIIITTKRGIEGEMTVEYNGYVSVGKAQKLLKILDADEFMYVYEQAWNNVEKYATSPNWDKDFRGPTAAGLSYSEMPHLFEQVSQGGYFLDLVGKDGNYYKPRFNTDWQDEMLRTSLSHNHQLNLRGGSQKAQYGAFFGFSDNQGIMLDSYFKRYTGRFTLDMKMNEWLSANGQLSYNRSQESTSDEPAGINTPRSAVESWPILPVKYPDDPEIYGSYAGQWGKNPDFPTGEDISSPIQAIKEKERFENRDKVLGDITFDIKFSPSLSFKSNFSVDANFRKFNYYGGRDVLGHTASAGGHAEINVSNTFYWQNENYFNFNKSFDNGHDLSAILGFSWSEYTWENVNVFNQRFFDDFYGWHNIGVGTHPRPGPGSSDGRNALNSYFGRANYNISNKYLFTATARLDGSSKFGTNSKYGFFPSGAFAWRISEENFMKDNSLISNLKLRLSVGETGNQEIGSYVTQQFLGTTSVVLGDASNIGLYPASFGNPDLKWETTIQYDLGVDIGILNNRFDLSVDYYHKTTEDMLLNVPLPNSTTTGSLTENYGSVQNAGIEAALNAYIVRARDFTWFANVNWSMNRNKIIKLGPTGADIKRNWFLGQTNILREGEAIGSFWGPNRLGTWGTDEAVEAARYGRVPGDLKYEDKNNDGVLDMDGADAGIIGNAFPKGEVGFTTDFTYKNWDLSIQLRAAYGVKKMDATNHSAEDRQLIAGGYNSILDAWRPDHQNSDIAQIRPGFGGAYYLTFSDSHWIQDASFLRGEGITLGYTLPTNILQRSGIRKVRLYASGRNFFVITPYKGYDPEGNSSDRMDSLMPNMDFYMYPKPTSYSFGVNLIF